MSTQFEPGRFPLMLAIAATLGLSACDTNSSQNTDGGSDARADVPVATEGGADSGSDADAGHDAAPDVVETTCPSDEVDLAAYNIFATSNAYVTNLDLSEFGAEPFNISGGSPVREASTIHTPANVVTSGRCFFAPGFPSWASPTDPDVNIGTMRIAVGASVTQFSFNTTMAHYVPNTTNANPLLFDTAGTFSVMGGDAGTITQDLRSPPRALRTAFAIPSQLSRSSDTQFTWTVPAGISPDTVATFWMFAPRFQNNAFCVVRACRRAITIPAAISTNYPAGTQVQVIGGYTSQVSVTVPGIVPFYARINSLFQTQVTAN